MKIIKRNGTEADFNIDKISIAVNKAIKETTKKDDEKLAKTVANIVSAQCYDKIGVEEIQDLVVKTLLGLGKTEIATKYIEYRATQAYKRSIGLQKLYNKMGDIVKFGNDENSNKNYKLPSVARDTIAGEYFRANTFRIIDPELAEAHRTKAIHWHDSDVDEELTNCCLINIENMLDNGTRVTNTDIETPKSVGTAMNIAMQIMASVSSQQYGGNSIPNFNEVFAKYAKKNFVKNFNDYFEFLYEKPYDDTLELDSANEELKSKYSKVFEKVIKKTAKEIYDACQLFEYQTNSILGSASQTPFSTITFNVPTSWESEQIILAYLKVRQTGLGALKIPAIFPKLSYIVVDGYNLKEGDKYFYITKEVSKCIAHTYYPDILFYSKEDYDAGKYYARMGE